MTLMNAIDCLEDAKVLRVLTAAVAKVAADDAVYDAAKGNRAADWDRLSVVAMAADKELTEAVNDLGPDFIANKSARIDASNEG